MREKDAEKCARSESAKRAPKSETERRLGKGKRDYILEHFLARKTISWSSQRKRGSEKLKEKVRLSQKNTYGKNTSGGKGTNQLMPWISEEGKERRKSKCVEGLQKKKRPKLRKKRGGGKGGESIARPHLSRMGPHAEK